MVIRIVSFSPLPGIRYGSGCPVPFNPSSSSSSEPANVLVTQRGLSSRVVQKTCFSESIRVKAGQLDQPVQDSPAPEEGGGLSGPGVESQTRRGSQMPLATTEERLIPCCQGDAEVSDGPEGHTVPPCSASSFSVQSAKVFSFFLT